MRHTAGMASPLFFPSWGGLLAAVAAFLAPGCDRAWVAYNQVELGKPLPRNHLLARSDPNKDPRVWSDAALIPVPPILSDLTVKATLDDAGNVAEKCYSAMALGHWGLYVTIAIRQIAEIEVPAEYFHEPPPGWTANRPQASTRPQGRHLGEFLCGCTYPNLCLSNQEPKGLNRYNLAISYPMMMYVGANYPRIEGVLQRPDALRGITRYGFEVQHTNEMGRALTIRNVGGRKIQIEHRHFEIVDPCFLTPLLRFIGTGKVVHSSSDDPP